MTEQDDTLARAIETLKERVIIDSSLDRRVMAAVEQLQSFETRSAPVAWWSRRWTIRLSPLGGLAAAATVAAVIVATSLFTRGGQPSIPAKENIPRLSGEVTQFVLVAPDAKSVALVGDFNDWSFSATQLARQAGDGVWWVTIPLPPGRYRYVFVVNGTSWRRDPNAPAAEDEFGRPNSVVTIGGA